MVDWNTMTAAEQLQARQDRLNEPGIEMPCPFCERPRVKRSDYTRCNRCGINWLDGEDLMRNPKAERWEKFVESARAQSTRTTDSSRPAQGSGVPIAGSSTR
jgi:ribosomal protein L37AE/L43A